MKIYMSAVTILLISTVFISTYSERSLSDDATEQDTATNQKEYHFESLNDRYSYAYGADLAEKFKTEGVELNVDVMAEAMQDVFGEGSTKMSAGEIAATIDIYMRIHERKKDAEKAVIGEKNKKEGEAFLAENADKEGVIVTKSGLQYKIINEGNGGYIPTSDDVVTVHYRGSFIDGTEFDSTYKRNEPYSVQAKKLIEGWGEALQLMSKGSKWELYIPSDLAYGEGGSEPYVGPNKTLIFEVELLDIEKEKAES